MLRRVQVQGQACKKSYCHRHMQSVIAKPEAAPSELVLHYLIALEYSSYTQISKGTQEKNG
jgi:hypothetical protein